MTTRERGLGSSHKPFLFVFFFCCLFVCSGRRAENDHVAVQRRAHLFYIYAPSHFIYFSTSPFVSPYPYQICSNKYKEKKKIKIKTMHFHPRVLLLLAAATLSTACSLPICAPGCTMTHTERTEYVSESHFCDRPGPFDVVKDSCGRLGNLTLTGGNCWIPPGGTYPQCTSTPAFACTYDMEVLYTDSRCKCPTDTSCSIEEECLAMNATQVASCTSVSSCSTVEVCGVEGYCMAASVDTPIPLTPSPCSIEAKCAAQQAKQVTKCPTGSSCSKVEVCDVTGYCQAVLVKGGGSCAENPCSATHDCTQDTPSNYTCAPKTMVCCDAMPTCGAGLNTSNTPCTAEEVSSDTCSRSAMCCSEVFCRTASCSIEAKCAAQEAKQVTECPADASCLTVSVCGVKGYCMYTTVPTPSTCSIAAKCAAAHAEEVSECPQDASCLTVSVCGAKGYCMYTTVPTPSTCSIAAKCAAAHAEEVSECPQDASCLEVEACGVKGYCMDVTYEGEGTCATKPCSGSRICSQESSSTYSCAPEPFACCEAAAVCDSGYKASMQTPCTAEEVAHGTCSRSAICCSEVFCRKGGSSGDDVPTYVWVNDDDVPAYAWALIALVSALLVVVVVSAVCLYRGRPHTTTEERPPSENAPNNL